MEQAGAVPLDETPLDETHPVVVLVVQPLQEDRLSRAIRLELDHLQFEKEAKRRFRRARARSPKSSTSLTLPCFLEHPRGSGRTAGLQPAVTYAALVPVIEYVSPISAVCAAAPVNGHATPALLFCRQER